MNLRTSVRTGAVALRAMLVLTLLLGVGYTLALTGIGQLVFPWQANGSQVDAAGERTGGWPGGEEPVGSALIGQLPAEDDLSSFFPRPSAAGDGYDPSSSSGSNLGPTNPELVEAIAARRAEIAVREGVSEDAVPADAVTASGSGLDPDISLPYALLQVPRVAEARGIAADDVRALVESRVQNRDLGFLGEPRVNVLELNTALDAQDREGR
ncbi:MULTISPECIES: potassium-transporting ATPase subunit KdpC [Microbacterium]|uniref:Potassium-transporting ATPase KdpC subunit n=1 Tax=Microbacterium resistens TaxID=156977 RepID=A0ABY3RNA4_9MICO|nr:potassium-transporting ATPase subunit KdpC [Microbacterium resistens]UGS25389.1 potassium-transporting ATPase subunit KdpC [Microbacterium resistens]